METLRSERREKSPSPLPQRAARAKRRALRDGGGDAAWPSSPSSLTHKEWPKKPKGNQPVTMDMHPAFVLIIREGLRSDFESLLGLLQRQWVCPGRV